MRLIDADELRGRIIAFSTGCSTTYLTVANIVMMINKADTVDAVPVVRCRNCKHWDEETGWCDIHSHFQDSDGEFCHSWESHDWKTLPTYYFCADGERRGQKLQGGDENEQT